MTPLEGLLQICDRIDQLQSRSVNGKPDPQEETLAAEKVRALRAEVFDQLPAIASHGGAKNLSDIELMLLSLLIHRRLLGDDRMMDGGSLVGLMHFAGYRRDETLQILDPAGRLRTGGWLHHQTHARGFDPIDTWYSTTAASLSLFWDKNPAATPPPLADGNEFSRPFLDEEEYLWDLYGWRNMCLARAEALFPADTPGGHPSPRFRPLRQDARAALMRMRRRLAQTKQAKSFRLEKFRHEHKLGMDHQLVLLHLLFSELVEGEPFISAIECLRVISETRHDLFRKRRLFRPNSRLRREGIVLGVEHADNPKVMAADLTLADWVTDELVSDLGGPPRLDKKELDDFLQGDDSHE